MATLCVVVAIASTVLPLAASAQTVGHEWEQYFYELAATTDYEDQQLEQAYDLLCLLERTPININTATRQQFQQIPFLTDAIIDDIQEYIYRHGPMRTLNELAMVYSLDYATRHLLRSFFYAGEPSPEPKPTLNDLLKRGRSELTATLRAPFYHRKGDYNGYLGYRYKHWLRYTFDAGERLQAAFTASQDAGEPFFNGRNSLGYDHYSFYVQLRHLGPVRRLVVGHYSVSFGLGLVANTSFALGKQSALASLGRPQTGIRPTASRSVANYLQGVAATIALGRYADLSIFASYRPHDATLNRDDGSVATIVTTGYHRTPTEMDKKNNTHSATAGFNVRFARNGFHVGTTAAYTHYDRELRPNTNTLYRRHYATGNDFVNASIDYGYTSHRLSARGELAVNRQGSMATVNSLTFQPSENLGLVALHRYYSYRYTAILANSFSEGGHVQNENGFYLGANWRITSRWQLNAYTDIAYFAWPRYLTSQASWAADNMIGARYDNEKFSLDAHYRLRIRQKDNDKKTALTNHTTHRVRLAATFRPTERWSSRTQADLSLYSNTASETGLMLSQSIAFSINDWLKLNAFAAYFNTESYDSRLYVYEQGPLYSFSSASYYGEGIRYSIMLRADLGRKWMILAKLATTRYFDRNTISSGLRLVNGSSMTDADIQVRLRF